jgi:antirestriction protein ArdC
MSEIRDVYNRMAAGRITRPLRHNGIPYKGINVVMLWSAAVNGYFDND